jgi:hypothetical protein
VRCRETNLFLIFLSAQVTFLPEGVIVGFQNFALGCKSQKKIRFGMKTNLGGPPCVRGGSTFSLFLENLKVLRIVNFFDPDM